MGVIVFSVRTKNLLDNITLSFLLDILNINWSINIAQYDRNRGCKFRVTLNSPGSIKLSKSNYRNAQ